MYGEEGGMYYGPDAIQEAQGLEGFHNVRQTFYLYDTVRIGARPAAVSGINGWFASFTAMASASGGLSFFDQRQESEAGTVYTNMKKKTGLEWPVIFADLGVDFYYPDPINVDLYDGDRTAAKQFCDFMRRHSVLELYTGGGDDKILTAPCEMLPWGFGMYGHQAGGNCEGYSSLLSNGLPEKGNRMDFEWALALPRDTSIRAKITFAPAANDMMTYMDTVKPIEFAEGSFSNEAYIKVGFLGLRDIQPVGNYFR